MKKAFTLVELLVVIGLMGLMGTIAIGGYSAVVRGMSDRAALDAAKGIADAAMQRANLDRTSTYIYLFDEVSKADSDMAAGVVAGVAVAVRPTGRITAVPEAGLFCDEFGDLSQTYSALDSEDRETSKSDREKSSGALRIYNIADEEYATVSEGVYSYTITDEDLEEGVGRNFEIYGFKKQEGSASFKVGQQYGQEFAVVRLPAGYTFGQSVTMSSSSDLGQKKVKVIRVEATASATPDFTVYARRPNGSFESIGSTSQVKDGKQ